MVNSHGKHILVVGSGSVGRRHARNFVTLGCRISCVDPRVDRANELRTEINIVESYTTLDEAISSFGDYDGVVVCSPPSLHVEQAIAALEAGMPVLLEKPVSADFKSALRLEAAMKKSEVPLLLGYTWRWWPPLKRVRELLQQGLLGDILYVQFHMSAHLADWHPWEPYQEFFMAQKALGGGALLDESHWIDLAIWLFGMPKSLIGIVEKISSLEISSDDHVDILMSYQNKLRMNMHLDLYGRPHEKFIRFIGEKGTLLWTVEPNQIGFGAKMNEWQYIEKFTCVRNDMFMGVAREFLSIINDETNELTCELRDGMNVLEIVSKARLSSQLGRKVSVRMCDSK